MSIVVEDYIGRGASEIAFVAKGHRPEGFGFIQREGEGEEEIARAKRDRRAR